MRWHLQEKLKISVQRNDRGQRSRGDHGKERAKPQYGLFFFLLQVAMVKWVAWEFFLSPLIKDVLFCSYKFVPCSSVVGSR